MISNILGKNNVSICLVISGICLLIKVTTLPFELSKEVTGGRGQIEPPVVKPFELSPFRVKPLPRPFSPGA